MAANKLVEQLNRDLLECGICLDRFKKPRGLPCLHCFCEECLNGYCKGQKQILCPICKKQTTVPEDGITAFPTHFMVNFLQETVDKVYIVSVENLKFVHKSWSVLVTMSCSVINTVIIASLSVELSFASNSASRISQ